MNSPLTHALMRAEICLLLLDLYGFGSYVAITHEGVLIRVGLDTVTFTHGDPLRDALDYMRAEALLVRAFGSSDLFSVFSGSEGE
jgi:hypothetical protein